MKLPKWALRSKWATLVMLMVFSLSGIVVNSFNFDYFVTSESWVNIIKFDVVTSDSWMNIAFTWLITSDVQYVLLDRFPLDGGEP